MKEVCTTTFMNKTYFGTHMYLVVLGGLLGMQTIKLL